MCIRDSRRPEAESGRLVADLDAAAATLRHTPAPAEPVPAAAPPPAERVRPTIVPASGHPPRVDAVGRSARHYPALRGAIVKLAHDDPHAAGRLIAALLPAHGAALGDVLDYDLTIREVGTYAVTVAGTSTRVEPVAFPRPVSYTHLTLPTTPYV